MSMRRTLTAGAIVLSLAASFIAVPFIKDKEGRSLVAYQDSVGVWTICDGETVGVKRGDKATNKQCDAATKARVLEFSEKVGQLINFPISAETHAAFTSFTYNVGVGNFSRSTALRKLNIGNIEGACDELLRWVYAGGKNCRIRSNQCYGIVLRRAEERALCLSGIKNYSEAI